MVDQAFVSLTQTTMTSPWYNPLCKDLLLPDMTSWHLPTTWVSTPSSALHFQDHIIWDLPTTFQAWSLIFNLHELTNHIVHYRLVQANHLVAGLLEPLVVHHLHKITWWNPWFGNKTRIPLPLHSFSYLFWFLLLTKERYDLDKFVCSGFV